MAWTMQTFQKELKKFDRHLRVRRSVVDPSYYLIERKCRRESACLRKPLERRGIDAWIRDKDGYIEVTRVAPEMLNQQVFLTLRQWDMWTFKHGGIYVDWLEEQERQQEAKLDKEQSDLLQVMGEEAYDRGMVKQGDIVSNFHSKVGGYEPGEAR